MPQSYYDDILAEMMEFSLDLVARVNGESLCRGRRKAHQATGSPCPRFGSTSATSSAGAASSERPWDC